MKHRLVGAAVLVGLGIIAWPVVFDTTPVREISQRSQIPAPPAMEPFEVAEPAPVALPPEPDSEHLRASIPDAPAEEPVAPVVEDAAFVPKARSPAAAAVPKVPAPTNDSQGLPEQWALQLGVFAARANALELRERAEKAGFHALVQPVGKGTGARYRVYVAPKLDRAAVARLAPDVQRKLGIKGYVTRYYP
jgi:DedD protein